MKHKPEIIDMILYKSG